MFLQISFFLYLLGLLLFSVFTGLNYYRIQAKGYVHPQVAIFLLPFILNFLMANFVFKKINPFLTTLAPCILIYLIGQKFKKVRIFGLTGGIGCGKSTLVKMMAENIGTELAIIDCDKINADLRLKGKSGYKIILGLLQEHGQNIKQYVNEHNQEIRREVLSKYSFEHTNFLRSLSKRVGKHIFLEIFKQIWNNCISNKKLILIDAPTLYQTKTLTYFCYPIIVVGCPDSMQIERLMQGRNMTEDEAKLRMQSQMPLESKRKLADIYVENRTTPDEMFCNTLKALNKVLGVGKK